ncbi:hypothetical protein [Paenibacillus sp. SN-8-1]|uniref:hypothetical protein n=1 Tax=Paenibacillus sp. SN-8-1 TaxID=3435409 RepID=UPI003D9A11A6
MSDFEKFEQELKRVAVDGEAARRMDHRQHVRRKIIEGTESMSNTLKLMGFLEQDNEKF